MDSNLPDSWVAIDDPDDARLADYVRLRETSLRRHLEAEHGLFIAEGEKVIRRAVEAGYRPRSFLLAERWLPGLADVLQQWPDVPVYVVSEELAEAVTGFHVHRGALASLHRQIRHTVTELLATSDRLVVIEDVVDHTNVGAVLRNAAALGWDGALLAPRAADPLYRRAIKVSRCGIQPAVGTAGELDRDTGAAACGRLHDDRVEPDLRRDRSRRGGRRSAGRAWQDRDPARHRGSRSVCSMDDYR